MAKAFRCISQCGSSTSHSCHSDKSPHSLLNKPMKDLLNLKNFRVLFQNYHKYLRLLKDNREASSSPFMFDFIGRCLRFSGMKV